MSLRTMTTRNPPLPVYLLTGFLGSGKTTLLSRLIHSSAFSDTAVIINEFGEVGLDHVLVDQSNDNDVVLLDSGCLCCATGSSLQDSLESLYFRRVRGEVPAFGRVVIETSGLADPGVIINTLAGDPSVARHFRFAGVITTVDAVHGIATLDDYREATAQVALADKIILTKTDLVDRHTTLELMKTLGDRNPGASLHASTLAGADEDPCFFDGISSAAHVRAADAPQALAPGKASTLNHVLKYGIAAYVFRIPGLVGWEAYATWTAHLQRHYGPQLLRIKGILPMRDGKTYAIHGVHHLFSPPAHLPRAVPAEQLGAMVFITQDLSRAEILATLQLLETPDAYDEAL